MQIYSIRSNDKYQQSFSSNYITGLKKNGKIYHTVTSFFRSDMNWDFLAEFLNRKYKTANTVNVLNLACSDGSEPVSLAVILLEKLGENAKKFFPIRASDFDEDMIMRAKSRIYETNSGDLDNLRRFTNNRVDKYFKIYPKSVQSGEILNKIITFKNMDILGALEDLKPQNNVILCRNCLSYLDAQDRTLFFKSLAKELDNTSCIIIGDMEKSFGYEDILKSYGFEQANVEKIYVKRNNFYPFH